MINRIFVEFFLAILMLATTLGCQENMNEVKPPPRHKNIPATAFWQGHLDGGQWYQCKRSTDIYSFHCTVYNENTGDIIISDTFTLYIENNGRRVPLKEFLEKGELSSNDIVGFNGYNMGLRGNFLLIPDKGVF